MASFPKPITESLKWKNIERWVSISFNGSGTFLINSSGQPPVASTTITAAAHVALTGDLATGLSTCITKDGQTTTTAVIPFAAGLSTTSITNSTGLAAGTYTPTITNTTNVTASVPYLSNYVRIGNQVAVFWSVDVNPAAAAPTSTEFQMTLPVASNFADTIQLTGSGNCLTVPAQTSTALSDASSDRAIIRFVATATGFGTHRGSFMYQVI